MSNPSKQLYEFPQRENNQSLRDRLTSKEWQFYIERFPELAAGDTHVIKVNADIVSAHTQEIFLSLPDRKVLTFGLDRFSQKPGGRPYWHGSMRPDRTSGLTSPKELALASLNNIFLSRYENRLRGEIYVAGQLYRLEFLGNDTQVLFSVSNPAKIGCTPIEDPAPAEAEAVPKQYPSHADSSKIGVLHLIAPSIWQNYESDFVDELDEAFKDSLERSNGVLGVSKIDMTYEYAGVRKFTFTEDYKNTDLLKRLTDTTTAIGRQIDDARYDLSAHLVLVSRWQTPLEDPPHRPFQDARQSTAFAVVGFSPDSITVNHQLGHLMGARHEWKPGPVLEPGYQFAYEFDFMGENLITLMGKIVADEDRPTYFVIYFSNPRLDIFGTPVGTVEHHDVARRFNERRFEVEAWYPRKK